MLCPVQYSKPFLFCRFAIDTMQSVCLDEFGGEKAVEPASQETTIIQHIFGGRLQSQVMHPVILKLFDFVLIRENSFSPACIKDREKILVDEKKIEVSFYVTLPI